MNVAIPIFATRVSPRFDCAQTVLVVEAADGQCLNRREIVFSGLAPHEKINRLLEMGIDTLVCGGIDRWSTESLSSAGVKIFAFATGEVEDALARLLDGNPIGEIYPPGVEMTAGAAGCFRRGRRGRGGMNRGLGGRGPFGMQGRGRDDL